MSLLTPKANEGRLLWLAQEWSVAFPAASAPLVRPDEAPTFYRAEDDDTAEMLLQRRATEAAQYRPKTGLSRAFSSSNLKKGKHWDPKDILEVLTTLITNSGSPGVAEALLDKLAAAGVDLTATAKQKSGILNRRRSIESFVDRSAMLHQAIDGGQIEMLQVLLPYADTTALDSSLPIAIRSGNQQIVEDLLRYGANIGENVESQDTFRLACAVNGLAPIIGAICQSEGRPPPNLASEALVEASKVGSLDTALQLSRSNADGNYREAEALRCAVALGRRDLVLAIIMGNRPPQADGLNEALLVLAEHPSLGPAAKLDITEALLCAGAQGDIPAHVLDQACKVRFYDMVDLLTSHGVSIEYNEAAALKRAIASSDLDMVGSLLSEPTTLDPSLASACITKIPKQATFEYRNALLTLLLQRGANGVALDQCLVDAAESGDIAAVDLLLQPNFPQSPMIGQPKDVTLLMRHAVANPNYRAGEALRTAVLKADSLVAEKILAARPDPETLSLVFPLTRNLYQKDRSQMIELFLRGSLSGECLHVALQDALDAPASQRDDALIKLLLDHGADINYNSGEALVPIIKQTDLKFLNGIIAKVSPQTASAHIKYAMRVTEHKPRLEILTMLLRMGAAIGTNEITNALLDALLEKPVDINLLKLLLDQGNGDINALEGGLVKKAMDNHDPQVLETLFAYGKPTDTTVSKALQDVASMFSNDAKRFKVGTLLAKSTRSEDLNRILLYETQSLIQHRDSDPSLSTFKQLLDSGADPNAYKSSALCHAVIAAYHPVLDMIFACRTPPKPASLTFALPHALRVANPDARLELTQRLVHAGAEPLEVNRALTYAIGAYPKDMQLLKVLASKADMSDGEALPMAIAKEQSELVGVLLSSFQHTKEMRHSAIGQTMEIKNRVARTSISEILLSSGVEPEISSGALLVAARDGDLALGEVLMAHGANISSNNGQAIIEGSRGGSVEVLSVLLKSGVEANKQTLEQAFQAATEVRDLNKRAVIFELLLSKGVSGVMVDSQLQSAARYGEPGEGILKVLLAAGADPNYNNGDAVIAATRSAFIGSLELLLGVWDDGNSQKRVSQPVLTRALKSSWALNRNVRFRVVQNLIKANLPISEELHKMLNQAVNEENPEQRLVEMLLEHGASPTTNKCQTIIDACRNVAVSFLPLLLDGGNNNISKSDISRAFAATFTRESFGIWFTEAGLTTAKLLLDKGAQGDALTEALIFAMKGSTTKTMDLADRFVPLLVSFGPDVNYRNGQPLQAAASKANVAWARLLLTCKPTAETISFAFQCIFDSSMSQESVLELFKLFAEYREGGVEIDVMGNVSPQGSDPILIRAISQYPRSAMIVSTLLDAGYYHDQLVQCELDENIGVEDVTVMMWAISQPQKKVGSSIIEVLIERGANVNVTSNRSNMSPLMLAVQHRRPDIVNMLLLEGAEVDKIDHLGRTPLAMATAIGGDVSVQIMASILAAEPCRDDGSLHNAARHLNLPAVKVLIGAGHDPDFPSTLHAGRSALAEVCLHGCGVGPATIEGERELQKVMTFLIDSNADLSIKADGKSVLLLCFDAPDPITTTRALLKSGMWKYINKPLNYFINETHTFSPTMYIKRILPPSDTNEDLIGLLRSTRATDVFYANGGAQPEGAIGLPEDMAVLERARVARLERLAEATQEHAMSIARRREAATIEQQIQVQRTEFEQANRRRLQTDELTAMRTHAQLEESIAAAALQRRLNEQQTLTEAAVARAKAIASAELDAEGIRKHKQLEWDNKTNREQADGARAITAIRISEREEMERIDRNADLRIGKRIEAQRRLVETQERLAKRIADGSAGSTAEARRQIGYVTELN